MCFTCTLLSPVPAFVKQQQFLPSCLYFVHSLSLLFSLSLTFARTLLTACYPDAARFAHGLSGQDGHTRRNLTFQSNCPCVHRLFLLNMAAVEERCVTSAWAQCSACQNWMERNDSGCDHFTAVPILSGRHLKVRTHTHTHTHAQTQTHACSFPSCHPISKRGR